MRVSKSSSTTWYDSLLASGSGRSPFQADAARMPRPSQGGGAGGSLGAAAELGGEATGSLRAENPEECKSRVEVL